MSQPYALTERQLGDFLAMRREWLNTPRTTGVAPGARSIRHEHDIAVVLLDDLPSGGTCRAAVLKAATSRERQILDLRGNVTEATTWRINYTPAEGGPMQSSPVLSASATAREVEIALESLDAFRPGDVRVEFGRHVRRDGEVVNLHRWIVEITGQYAGGEFPLLDPEIVGGASIAFTVAEGTVVEDTGATVVVRSLVPVGTPTPMRRGALAVCAWLEGFGWTVHAVEVREILSVYG